jgi:putative DNA primase/helicase
MPSPRAGARGPGWSIADIARAAESRAEQLVASWLPGGRREGHEWKCGDLSGAPGGSLSVAIGGTKVGRWADFATDAKGGDLVSLYAAIRGIGQGEAAKEVAQQIGMALDGPPAAGGRAPDAPKVGTDTWTDAGPAPPEAAAPVAHVVRGKPDAVWIYRDRYGHEIGRVNRFRTSSGGKEILPLVWSKHPERGSAWRWRQFADPRPLYARDLLERNAGAPVLIVEGEKCADAAQAALGDAYVVTSWPGGCKAVGKVDWTPLRGRHVVLWPDADAKLDAAGQLIAELAQPGMQAMHKIAGALKGLAASVRIVDIPAPGTVADGWDVADLIEERGPAAVAHFLEQPTAELPTPDAAAQAEEADAWRKRLVRRKDVLTPGLLNVRLILENDRRWGGVVAFDEFAQRTVKRKPPPWPQGKAGEWEGDDDTRTAMWLSEHYGCHVSSDTVGEAVEVVARDRGFHPVREFLRGLPAWDGVRRLDEMLVRYAQVDDTEYARTVSTYFLRGMVARVMDPGCKFDTCLVLEGEEGLGKSSFAAALGGRWYSDTDLDLTHKDAMSALRGKWVHEFSEMDSVTRAEASKQKSFLSRQVDEFRPVYGRREIRCPRQTVFIGSTNELEYIKEGQGARRFWPVTCRGPIDVQGLRKALPQLFAEAVHDVDAGERFYPDADQARDLFRPQQQRRVMQSSLVDALHDWVLDPSLDEMTSRQGYGGMFSLADAALRGLHLTAAQLTRDMETRIGKALAQLGCKRIEKRNGMTRFWYQAPRQGATDQARQQAQQDEGVEPPVPF